ncbi:hypothetical protein N7452_004545 [Penicillium brevicompactum]|uniref:Uncharacterized protein n=1 Tax=Penicillium brevicompactum TaxID=5074 RepID=A0A9W9QGY7_PENBR|nr:hypothetical protein N7452_004545 [Penicillium brevicompactum]
MPRPHLSQDPYNLERMGIMATIHEVIYLLRNTTNRVPQIIDMLNGIFGKLPNAISSSASERDYEFEICTRDLEQMIPISISRIRRSDDENLKSFAKELIDCIPETLQNPALWDLEVGEATSEAGSAGRQHVRREDVVIIIKLVIIPMDMILTVLFTGVVITAAGSKDDLLCPNLADGRYDSSGTP